MSDLADSDLDALEKAVRILDDNPDILHSDKMTFLKSFILRHAAELAEVSEGTQHSETCGQSESILGDSAGFAKGPEERRPQFVKRDVQMSEAYKAVGAIYRQQKFIGTGFLLKGHKIITCLHVFLLDVFGKTPPDSERKTRDDIEGILCQTREFQVNFTLYSDIPVAKDNFPISKVCYLSTKLDVLILGLDFSDNVEAIPLPLLDFGELSKDDQFCLVGHPEGKGKQRDHCKLRTNFDPQDATERVKDILRDEIERNKQDKTHDFKLETIEELAQPHKLYPKVGDNNFYIYDTHFAFGASGSPGLRANFAHRNEVGKVEVVTMMTGGEPSALLKTKVNLVPTVLRRNLIRNTYYGVYVEHGVKMSAVYQQIRKDDPTLANQIFIPGHFPEKWYKPGNDVQYSEGHNPVAQEVFHGNENNVVTKTEPEPNHMSVQKNHSTENTQKTNTIQNRRSFRNLWGYFNSKAPSGPVFNV